MDLKQLTASQTATRNNITEQFTPPQDVIDNAQILWDKILGKINVPFFVSCWYRCPRLNKAVGGSATSDHVLGKAADLDNATNQANKILFEHIKSKFEFDQLIWEFGDDNGPDWVHVSYRKNNCRNQVLRAYKVNGKTTYKAI